MAADRRKVHQCSLIADLAATPLTRECGRASGYTALTAKGLSAKNKATMAQALLRFS